MTLSQKAGVVVIRALGAAMIVPSIMLLALAVVRRNEGLFVTSLFWVTGGVLLVLVSKPLGRWIGAGLD